MSVEKNGEPVISSDDLVELLLNKESNPESMNFKKEKCIEYKIHSNKRIG